METSHEHHTVATRLLRLEAVIERTGRGRSSIYADKTFPRPVHISAKSVAWVESEVETWIAERINKRDHQAGAK